LTEKTAAAKAAKAVAKAEGGHLAEGDEGEGKTATKKRPKEKAARGEGGGEAAQKKRAKKETT
jgi:hypothetical protein